MIHMCHYAKVAYSLRWKMIPQFCLVPNILQHTREISVDVRTYMPMGIEYCPMYTDVKLSVTLSEFQLLCS